MNWSAICVPFLCCGLLAAQGDDPPPAEQRGEARVSLALTEEGSFYGGLRVPIPDASNLVLLQPSFGYRHGDRWRFTTSLAGMVSTNQETHSRLRVRETYFGVSAWDLDLTAGKKILRWGTGYAFTPTGVLDPPRIATDPTDRLNLNEGREMLEADWIKGRHAVAAVWASGGLLKHRTPRRRETVAFRYNTLVAGFDTSVIVAQDRGSATFAGANFTRVFGESIEIHGEFARRDSPAVLLGGKYTARSGWGAIFEYYSPADSARRHYGFLRVSKSRLRELPGWKEWDVAASLVANLRDGSRVAVVDVGRRVGNHVSFYTHALFPAGKRGRSEYGMIPFSALISAGFRVQL